MLEENTKLVSEVYEANFLQKEAQIKAYLTRLGRILFSTHLI